MHLEKTNYYSKENNNNNKKTTMTFVTLFALSSWIAYQPWQSHDGYAWFDSLHLQTSLTGRVNSFLCVPFFLCTIAAHYLFLIQNPLALWETISITTLLLVTFAADKFYIFAVFEVRNAPLALACSFFIFGGSIAATVVMMNNLLALLINMAFVVFQGYVFILTCEMVHVTQNKSKGESWAEKLKFEK